MNLSDAGMKQSWQFLPTTNLLRIATNFIMWIDEICKILYTKYFIGISDMPYYVILFKVRITMKTVIFDSFNFIENFVACYANKFIVHWSLVLWFKIVSFYVVLWWRYFCNVEKDLTNGMFSLNL